ncbi:MAG: CARDB domain-containing protein [Promethearchaeota archaeon]
MNNKQNTQIFLFFYVLILITTSLNFISPSSALINNDSIDKEDLYSPDTFTSTLNGKKYLAEYITREKVEELKQKSELRDLNKNYNQIIDGHGTGYAPPTPEELEKLIGKVSLIDIIPENGYHSYKASADISTEIYFPTVGNQGGQGSCTAWANIYYAYGYMEAKDYGWNASSGNTDYLLSPAWAYNKIAAYDYGSWPVDAAELIMDWGVSTLSTMPYDDTDVNSWGEEPAWREAPFHRPLNYTLIPFTGPTTIDIIKSLLDSGIPVTIGIDAYQFDDGFYDSNYIISSAEYNPFGGLNHAQCFVGYDDAITDDGDLGAFRVVNSWGLSFAEMGYYWLTYDAFSEFANDPDQFILYYTDRIDYNPSLISTWEFSTAPTRMDDIITLGVGPYNSPLDTITPPYDIDIVNTFPEFMVLDISDFQTHYDANNEVYFFLDVGSSVTTGTISSFKIERYISGILEEITPESPDVPLITPGYANAMFIDLDHDLKIMLEAPDSPEISTIYIINATVINNGIYDESNINLFLYLDSIIVNSTTISLLGAGANYTITYSWTPIEYGTYNFSAYSPPVMDEVYVLNNFRSELAFVRMAVFFDDFESGLGKWESITGLWHLTDTGSTWPDPCHSPTHAMWFGNESTGNYDTWMREYGELVSIPFSLLGVEMANLEFFHWREGESGWDVSFVYISIDGINWDLLYSTSLEILPWEKKSIDITAYAGNPSVQLKFFFDTHDESYNDFRGWLVDDIRVLMNVFDHALSVSLDTPINPQIGNSYLITATVTNVGTSDENDVDLLLYLDDAIVESTTFSNLPVGSSETINYTWIPPDYGIYNFTAYAPPVSKEIFTENNYVTDIIPILDTPLFDGMYLNYNYSNSGGMEMDMKFLYSYLSGDLFSNRWFTEGALSFMWEVNCKTRVMTGGSPFGDNTHSPFWIFPNVSLSDEILIATDGIGDHIYNVADERTYDHPIFGMMDVWVLEDITLNGSYAWYEKSTGILLKGKFYDDSGIWWFAVDCTGTNVNLANTITVINPSSGDSWAKGSTHYITWTSTGSITDVKIELYKDGAFEMEIVPSISNGGSYLWTIPTGLENSTLYQIRISDASDSLTYDESDYFTIMEDTGDGDGIPGYNLLFLFGTIIALSIISIRKLFKRKLTVEE